MKYEVLIDRIIIEPDKKTTKKTVEQFLEDYCQSRKNRYLLIQNRMILLDDIPVKNPTVLIGDHKITVLLEKSEVDKKPADAECQVIYEDPFLYIVHKPPGIIIHDEENHCLNNLAARYQINHNIEAPVRPIHRLDKDTTGLVFYSKIPFFQPWFDQQLSDKKIRRSYLAITKGNCKKGTKFTVNEKIGKDRHHSNRYRVSPTGVDAVTHFECLASDGKYSLFRCILETGRTHQIRVHLSHKGYPIINDPIYGIPSEDFDNMCLWADEITFHNPISNKKHRIHDIPNIDYAYFNQEESQS